LATGRTKHLPGFSPDEQPPQTALRYTVDTQGGNSGSPVIVEGGGNVAIGIHTHGGCSATGGSNAGTGFRYQGLGPRSATASSAIPSGD
jgi:hypothetical protein